MQVSSSEAAFEEVLVAAQQGDDRAWSTLYREFAGPLRGYLFSKGAREPDDLLGEIFVDVARRLHAFSGSAAQFRSWLFMVAHNRVIDERRRFTRRPADPVAPEDLTEQGSVHDVADDVVRKLMAGDALALIDSLTPDQRQVLRLRLVDGLTVDEVAEALDRPPGAVKALQRRGLAAALRAREHQHEQKMGRSARTPSTTGVGNPFDDTHRDLR